MNDYHVREIAKLNQFIKNLRQIVAKWPKVLCHPQCDVYEGRVCNCGGEASNKARQDALNKMSELDDEW